MSSPENLLAIRGLNKSYGPVRVLTDIALDLCPGEVHALVGENGAGKSTLSRIIGGLTRSDSGTMTLNGQPYTPRTKRDASRQGVRIVVQELNLVRHLTVAESIFIERLPHRWGWINTPLLHQKARQALDRVGLMEIDPSRLIGDLGVGQQQLIEIAAGLSQRCDILILDEPTAALTDPEIEHLFAQIIGLKTAGTAILYISHRLEEVKRIANQISILRDGKMVTTRGAEELDLNEIVHLMVGREFVPTADLPQQKTGSVAMRVTGLRRRPTVEDVSFEVRHGEILGFAGLMGSGRTETLRALFGADTPDAVNVFLRGNCQTTPIRSPREAVRNGIALLTEDRKEQGLLLPLDICANITLPSLNRIAGCAGWIDRSAEKSQTRPWIQALGVRCRGLDQPAGELSGGNQQKLIIAKWLMRDCDILMFDEPTRGIDVGAKHDIYQMLKRLAAQGKAILVVSSDLKELLVVADRIAVMSAGRLVATYDRGEWGQEQIMDAALSGYRNKRQQAGEEPT